MMLGIDYNGTGTAAAGADDGTASWTQTVDVIVKLNTYVIFTFVSQM